MTKEEIFNRIPFLDKNGDFFNMQRTHILEAMQEYATQEKQGWVKTLEAKPEREDNFLVITRGTRCIRAFSDDEFIDADGIVITKQISHWRELPQKPEV